MVSQLIEHVYSCVLMDILLMSPPGDASPLVLLDTLQMILLMSEDVGRNHQAALMGSETHTYMNVL